MNRFAFLVLWIILLSSCAITIKPALEGPPVVEPLELTMGKCFSPAISNYEYRSRPRSPAPLPVKYIFPLGPPSVAMFDRVFTGMFVKTVPVEHCPPATDQGLDVDAVIETQIERFWWYITPVSGSILRSYDTSEVKVTYRFLLYSPEGETIDSWTVVGSGLNIPKYIPGTSKFIEFLPEATWLSAAVKLAMRDAAADFITEFRDRPKIREWIQKRDVSSGERQ